MPATRLPSEIRLKIGAILARADRNFGLCTTIQAIGPVHKFYRFESTRLSFEMTKRWAHHHIIPPSPSQVGAGSPSKNISSKLQITSSYWYHLTDTNIHTVHTLHLRRRFCLCDLQPRLQYELGKINAESVQTDKIWGTKPEFSK